MFLIAITVGLCMAYFAIRVLFGVFFGIKLSRPSNSSAGRKAMVRALRSICLIFAFSVIGYVIALNIPDAETGNRILHGFGGGFMAFFVCFLAAKDLRADAISRGLGGGVVGPNRFQFFVLSVLLVAALGIGNEIMEFLFQNHTKLIFAVGVNDTWLDLISNLIGSVIAAICFVPFFNTKK